MSIQCSNCGSVNTDDATFCTNCGTPFSVGRPAMINQPGVQVQQKSCVSCHRMINVTFTTCPFCGVVQPNIVNTPGIPAQSGSHNKLTAGLLAIFLGTFGIHKFYLGQSGQGIIYLLLCWTGIPSILGVIEGIIYITSSDQAFLQKYG